MMFGHQTGVKRSEAAGSIVKKVRKRLILPKVAIYCLIDKRAMMNQMKGFLSKCKVK